MSLGLKEKSGGAWQRNPEKNTAKKPWKIVAIVSCSHQIVWEPKRSLKIWWKRWQNLNCLVDWEWCYARMMACYTMASQQFVKSWLLTKTLLSPLVAYCNYQTKKKKKCRRKIYRNFLTANTVNLWVKVDKKCPMQRRSSWELFFKVFLRPWERTLERLHESHICMAAPNARSCGWHEIRGNSMFHTPSTVSRPHPHPLSVHPHLSQAY